MSVALSDSFSALIAGSMVENRRTLFGLSLSSSKSVSISVHGIRGSSLSESTSFLSESLKKQPSPSFQVDSYGSRLLSPTPPLKNAPKNWNTEDLQISAFTDDILPPAPFQQTDVANRNRADDISLRNPLQRQHRLGCGWLGVILEWEGVIVEDDANLEQRAWYALAEEEGRPRPLAFILKRAQGMKNEQAISEVLCWGRDLSKVKSLARRKEELYQDMQGGVYRLKPGSKEFVETLRKYDIPVGVASTRPRKYLETAIEAVGMEGVFDVVISAEDVYRGKPDPEMFQYAAERLGFIPERCIVVGNSNKTIEAAHDGLMKVVSVVGMHPAYELGAADLVVHRLDELSVVDLKNLADLDSPEFLPPEEQFLPEMELEEEIEKPQLTFADDIW